MWNERQSSPVPEGAAWTLNRLAYRVFATRWFWLAIGLFVGGGGVLLLSVPPLRFHFIEGRVARYSFADRALRLVGDRTKYFFVPDNFPSPLPTRIPTGTWVRIWIDGTNPDIDALQPIGQSGLPEATYEDIFFANPARQDAETRIFAVFFAASGAVSVLGSLLWPLLNRTSRRTYRPYDDVDGL